MQNAERVSSALDADAGGQFRQALRTRMDETGVSLIPKGFRIEFLVARFNQFERI